MNSSENISRASLIGKTELKTSCSPSFFRSSGGTSTCRKDWKDLSWTSSRFGIGMFQRSLSLEKLLVWTGCLFQGVSPVTV